MITTPGSDVMLDRARCVHVHGSGVCS